MTTALLFAGQGVAPPWIAAELVARAEARLLVEALGDATGQDGARLLLRGGAAFARTEVLQPALVTACLIAATALADAGVEAAAVCGHSLGELAAWAAGGFVSATDAIAVAAVRGRLMAREAARFPGGMAVVTGDVAAALACGSLVVAARNAPEETVLAGDAAAIAAVVAAGRGKKLDVAGAWHSAAMAGAVAELEAALAAVPQRGSRSLFVSNRDGRVAEPAAIPTLLAGQLVRPIEWTAAARTLAALGVTRYVVAGPGRVVRALLRANLGDVDIQLVDGARALARVAA